MATHEEGVRIATEEKGLCVNLFNGMLRFEVDGSSYFGFAYRIEPDDGYVPFPLLNLHPPPRLVWNSVAIFPLCFPCLHPAVSRLRRLVWASTFSTA